MADEEQLVKGVVKALRKASHATLDADENIPTAIRTGKLELSGVTLRVHVLDDGRRVINADDMNALFLAWEQGSVPSEDEAQALARFIHELGAV